MTTSHSIARLAAFQKRARDLRELSLSLIGDDVLRKKVEGEILTFEREIEAVWTRGEVTDNDNLKLDDLARSLTQLFEDYRITHR